MFYRKYKVPTKLEIILLLLLLSIYPGVKLFEKITNPLSKPVEKIREDLLKKTPLLTHRSEVLDFIKSNYDERPVLRYSSAIFSDTIGERCYYVFLGEHSSPQRYSSTSIFACWFFDEDDYLIEIKVIKR